MEIRSWSLINFFLSLNNKQVFFYLADIFNFLLFYWWYLNFELFGRWIRSMNFIRVKVCANQQEIETIHWNWTWMHWTNIWKISECSANKYRKKYFSSHSRDPKLVWSGINYNFNGISLNNLKNCKWLIKDPKKKISNSPKIQKKKLVWWTFDGNWNKILVLLFLVVFILHRSAIEKFAIMVRNFYF
jgi:hypothetical protein